MAAKIITSDIRSLGFRDSYPYSAEDFYLSNEIDKQERSWRFIKLERGFTLFWNSELYTSRSGSGYTLDKSCLINDINSLKKILTIYGVISHS